MFRNWIKRRFDVDFTAEGVRRMLHRPGFRHVSPRPVHSRKNPEDQWDFRDDFSQLAKAVLPYGVAVQPGDHLLETAQQRAEAAPLCPGRAAAPA